MKLVALEVGSMILPVHDTCANTFASYVTIRSHRMVEDSFSHWEKNIVSPWTIVRDGENAVDDDDRGMILLH